MVRCLFLSYPAESVGDRCPLCRNYSPLAKRIVTRACPDKSSSAISSSRISSSAFLRPQIFVSAFLRLAFLRMRNSSNRISSSPQKFVSAFIRIANNRLRKSSSAFLRPHFFVRNSSSAILRPQIFVRISSSSNLRPQIFVCISSSALCKPSLPRPPARRRRPLRCPLRLLAARRTWRMPFAA